MLVLYSKIIGVTVSELKTQSVISSVADIVISPKELTVSGIILKNDSIFKKNLSVINVSDLCEVTAQAILVCDIDAVIDANESVRIKEQIEKGCVGIGQKVVTKSGKNVGKVFDILIQSDTFSIMKFYVKNVFSEKIFSRDSVISYSGKKIVIKDDFETVKVSAVAETCPV